MNIIRFTYKSFIYYRAKNFIVFLGIVLSTGILTGSLMIGDSVKYSLRGIVDVRLGKTEFVIASGTNLFHAPVAGKLSGRLHVAVAPVLQVKGFAGMKEGTEKYHQVHVYGVDHNFWNIGNTGLNVSNLDEDEAIINKTAAEKLNLQVGDEILIKLEKIRFLPSDAPFVPEDKNSVPARFRVRMIVSGDQFGNFNLKSNQITPANIFTSLKSLNKLMSLNNYANILLVGEGTNVSVGVLSNETMHCLTLDDLNLRFRKIVKTNQLEIVSDRIFIADTIVNIIKNIDPGSYPVFTYLVNAVSNRDYETPYSFCSSPAELIDPDVGENDIILNQWLADDLHAEPGDSVSISYFVFGPLRKLVIENKKFHVSRIVPIAGFAADSLLMPEFEGLADVNQCKDWEAGVPVDLKKIRQKDENYWKKYRGTPKAFIHYQAAKRMWGTRYGNCTALRLNKNTDTSIISAGLLSRLSPESAGLQIIPVRKNGLEAAGMGVDFGQLFLGLGFFLILAALVLSSLLFFLSVKSRGNETGILAALGFSNRKIRKILILESMLILIPGVILGAFSGILFNKLVLLLLNNIWVDAVRSSMLLSHTKFSTLFLGMASGFTISFVTIFLTIVRIQLAPVNILLRKGPGKKPAKVSLNLSRYAALILLICALAIFFYSWLANHFKNPVLCFFSGIVLLSGFIISWRTFLVSPKLPGQNPLSILNMGIRNLFFRRNRSFLQFCLIATGVFLIVTTGLNRAVYSDTAADRKSGSGGFSFYVETSVPVLFDLNSARGKNKYDLTGTPGLSFVQFKVLPGDDASCLNLNRVAQPGILAVMTDEFYKRGSFNFVQVDSSVGNMDPWKFLNKKYGKNCYPAIADQSVITWGIGKSVGDTLKYTNEQGDTIFLKLIAGLENSIFQGNVIMARDFFIENFPGIGGSSVFLVECDKPRATEIRKLLENRFGNLGVSVQPTADRLAMFHTVTNTYLDIFISLGGLALLLSVAGTAILISGNINEQKYEYAMMMALGIQRGKIIRVILIENGIILLSGIIAGVFSGITGTLPSLSSGAASLPLTVLTVILIACAANGLFWIYFISQKTLSNNIRLNLRND